MTDPYNAYQLACQLVDEKFNAYLNKGNELYSEARQAVQDLMAYLQTLEPQHVDISLDEIQGRTLRISSRTNP